ncbi:hypothetical protein PQX77_001568, partial [Marasmius sp. AFHP31]
NLLVTITGPSDKAAFPPRFTHQLIKQLQHDTAPNVFQPAGVYDGKKNLYMPHLLDLGKSDSALFNIPFVDGPSAKSRPPVLYTVKLTKVAEINPEVLQRFVDGLQSQDEGVSTTLMAMNVAIRQDPILRGFAFNTRSFFPNTDDTLSDSRMGLQFGRGIFQSIRPTLGKVILNTDITTAMFYRYGALTTLCTEYLQAPDNPEFLSPTRGLPDRERIRLQRFVTGIRARVVTSTTPNAPVKTITIAKLTDVSAREFVFTQRDGKKTTVASYFQKAHNKSLRYPDIICALTASGAAIPLELLTVLPGQIARKQVPPEVTAGMVAFSKLEPPKRLTEINKGLQLLAHGQSEYVRNFGMSVSNTSVMSIDARIINPPRLQYGAKDGKRLMSVDPRHGSWNLMDKTFIQPRPINRWTVVILESEGRFSKHAAREMVKTIIESFATVGMRIHETDPIIVHANPQRDISLSLRQAGAQTARKHAGPDGQLKNGPDLMFAVLPDLGNAELYRRVKHFGDIETGVVTQCLKASLCKRARIQYWANVASKVNPKLGGINHKPDPSSPAASNLNDPHCPTVIMGADVMHPSPGSNAPSYTAVVTNVDSDAAKYIAESRVQTSRVEIIEDLEVMVKNLLKKYMNYREQVEKHAVIKPSRLLFFRDGVSEGQYQQVKDLEIRVIRQVCHDLGIDPKITFIIVAKRHHFRFFPKEPSQADRSGNCPAGTVVDTGITHPTEFDFYLQSHGGLLGTSRSAHYHVLEDDSGFTADAMQSLCYGLCHVFARSTRTISVPAPVAHADIVCSRAPNHYRSNISMSDVESTKTGGSHNSTLEQLKAEYKPVHPNHQRRTFFT